MELNFDYKVGCYFCNTKKLDNELVIYHNIYKLVTIVFQPTFRDGAFQYRVYDLSNKVDIERLNANTQIVADSNPTLFYKIAQGTIVEYDYREFIYLKRIEKKIMSFELERPLLFDYLKARDKYLAMEVLGEVHNLQTEFDNHYSEYFRIPIQSQEKIDWTIISEPIRLEEAITEKALDYEFGTKATESITMTDFLKVIDTKKLEGIADPKLREQIGNLIKQTLAIAKENESIGYGEMYVERVKDIEGARKFSIAGNDYIQVVAKYPNGEERTGFLDYENGTTYSDTYFYKMILDNKPPSDFGIFLIDIAENKDAIVPKKEEKKAPKKKFSKEELEQKLQTNNIDDLLVLLDEID